MKSRSKLLAPLLDYLQEAVLSRGFNSFQLPDQVLLMQVQFQRVFQSFRRFFMVFSWFFKILTKNLTWFFVVFVKNYKTWFFPGLTLTGVWMLLLNWEVVKKQVKNTCQFCHVHKCTHSYMLLLNQGLWCRFVTNQVSSFGKFSKIWPFFHGFSWGTRRCSQRFWLFSKSYSVSVDFQGNYQVIQ